MKRWLPSPWLSLGLFAGWLLLTRSFGIGQVLLGLGLALAMPLLTRPLRPRPGPLRRLDVLARLILRVGRDVLRSAIDVGIGVLRLPRQVPRGAFVRVPLDLRDVHALASLSMITAVIPGTVWSELAADRSSLLIHVYDLADEAAFIAHYKRDYELPLKEIFE
jgi:multicomponent K+:H+ antiporter subunit E